MNNDAERKTEGMFIGNDGVDGSLSITDTNWYDQSLLWVHLTTWQQQLMLHYDNTISLIDATYKTTKYDLALFLICVKTNVGYAVVAEFISQCESAQHILEALSTLIQWNPQWNPQFFMCDYTEAELQALESAFPDITVYLCDFHREQAWDRWMKKQQHGLTQREQQDLLALLRQCAWAPPATTEDQNSPLHLAVSDLKNSQIWKDHESVHQWLSTKWLPIAQVCIVHVVNCMCTCVS